MNLSPSEKRLGTRRELWGILHDGRGKAGQIFNFVLIVLILLSLALVAVRFLPSPSETFTHVMIGLEILIVAVFTVEYILRIYSAPRRLRYIFSFFGIVDLLSIVPFYSGLFGGEYIRLLRLVRFLKIGEMQAGAAADSEADMTKSIGLVEGEHVSYVITKHPLYLFLHSLIPATALMFSLGIFLLADGDLIGVALGVSLTFFALILLLKTWLDFNYDVIYLSNYRLVFHNQHLFGRSINQVNYLSITNVKPSYSSIMSFLFRFGSLDIETAAEHPGQIQISMVRAHEKAAHMIMEKCFAAQNQQNVRVAGADDND